MTAPARKVEGATLWVVELLMNQCGWQPLEVVSDNQPDGRDKLRSLVESDYTGKYRLRQYRRVEVK